MKIDLAEATLAPDPLTKPARVSLADNVADLIAKAIATRHILPGARIVETALAERLGVSRVPIREALKVLHAQGILVGGGHRGYHVASFGPEVTQQILEVRLTLESILLRDAIENWRAGREEVTALQRPIEEMKRAALANDIPASLLADLEFHRTIREAARNAIVGTLWDTIARHVMIVFNFERYRDKDLNAVARQHESFRDFIYAQVEEAEASASELVSTNKVHEALEDHILLIERSRRKGRA